MPTSTRNSTSRRFVQWIAVAAALAMVTLAVSSSFAASPSKPGVPSAPRTVSAKSVGKGMRVSWQAPVRNNGFPITGYIVIPRVNGKALKAHPFASRATSQVITGLRLGKAYTFTVRARNAKGAGPASRSSKYRRFVCVGRALTNGQRTINSSAPGTTFCLSGTHNWNLTPRSGDRFLGPAVLDGGGSTNHAFEPGNAKNVVLSGLEIRNYRPGNQLGAVQSNHLATGWTLQNLQVHHNGDASGGAGANLGPKWKVLGGRYHHNGQEGLSSAIGDGAVVNGAEIDHNNLRNGVRNIACGYDAGGFKWIANNVTVANSRVHDNACVGLWMDINSKGAVLTHNHVYNNWDEGIFVEISHNVRITGNTVSGNGFKSFRANCKNIWLYGGGITLAASDHVTITGNHVAGNCNGITGTQENRPDGNPGLLSNIKVHNNTVAGPGGKTGVGAYPRPIANLATRNISFTANRIKGGVHACGYTC